MSLATQFQALQKKTSDFLLEMIGCTGIMEDATDPTQTFSCFYSPAQEAQQMQAFGFRSDFNLLLHVPKTEPNFVPEIGKNVKLLGVGPDGSDLVARLVRPRVHPAGVDHVFECKSQW